MDDVLLVNKLIQRLHIEHDKKDRSGIYGVTSRELAYNSNKIEGSTLTKDQTAALFDMGVLPQSDDYYKAKDIEEMNGHFLMFNKMLETLDTDLTEQLIKDFHYSLKAGVFEDRANGYAIGDYKKRPNMIGTNDTARPEEVEQKMQELLAWYYEGETDLKKIALFHAKYEVIHPFQDGNGRTGRLIAFRECLKNGIMPFIVEDDKRVDYIFALKEYRDSNNITKLYNFFESEQQEYRKTVEKFIF